MLNNSLCSPSLYRGIVPWEIKRRINCCNLIFQPYVCHSLSPSILLVTSHRQLHYSIGETLDKMSNLPLPQFYAQTLLQIAPIIDDTLSSSDPSVLSTLSSALNDLHLIGRMMTSLGVFSENEGVEEIGDGELRFMSLGWVVGECEGRLGLQGRDDRTRALKRSEVSRKVLEIQQR